MGERQIDDIRRGFALYDRAMSTGDEAAFDEMLTSYAPDAVIDFTATLPDAPAGGPKVMKEFFRGLVETGLRANIEPREIVDRDPWYAVAVHATAPDPRITFDAAYLFRHENGQTSYAKTFRTLDEALAAIPDDG